MQVFKGETMLKTAFHAFVVLATALPLPATAMEKTINMNPDAKGSYGSQPRIPCAPDARRLCASVINDAGARAACLRQNMASLSPACRASLR